jgi:uncharacterized protein YyaL (SSP411 family)
LTAACKAADFITDKMTMPDGGVYHVWRDKVAKIPGFLDDYAFLANALLDIYESTFDAVYLHRATHLVELILEKFWDNGLYFTPSDGEPLVHRPRVIYDNVCPSGISSTVFALIRLYELNRNESYLEYIQHVFHEYKAAASRTPFNFAYLLSALEFMEAPPVTMVFSGDRGEQDVKKLMRITHQAYLPSSVKAFADDVFIGQGKLPLNNQATVYICRNQTCDAPLTSVEQVTNLVQNLLTKIG